MGPGERFFIEYIGRQSTSEADDGRRGPHEGRAENQSWDDQDVWAQFGNLLARGFATQEAP